MFPVHKEPYYTDAKFDFLVFLAFFISYQWPSFERHFQFGNSFLYFLYRVFITIMLFLEQNSQRIKLFPNKFFESMFELLTFWSCCSKEEILPVITLSVLNDVEFLRTPCLIGFKAAMGDVLENYNKLTNQRDGLGLQLCPEIHVMRCMLKFAKHHKALTASFQKI